MYPEIKMVTRVSADDVRRLCVKYNLFVCGTLRDYDAMLDEVTETKNWDDWVIVELARKIVWYSDTDNTELFADCTTLRQCVVRLANIIEAECVKRCYEIIE